jgi:hypothetical protein
MELPLAVAQNLTLQIEGPEAFDVRQFTLEDGLSTLFYVDLVVTSSNPAVDLDELIGKPGTFSIGLDPSRYPASPVRTYAGVVSEILQLRSEASGLSTYQLTVSPTPVAAHAVAPTAGCSSSRAISTWCGRCSPSGSIEALVECTRALEDAQVPRAVPRERLRLRVSRLLEVGRGDLPLP